MNPPIIKLRETINFISLISEFDFRREIDANLDFGFLKEAGFKALSK